MEFSPAGHWAGFLRTSFALTMLLCLHTISLQPASTGVEVSGFQMALVPCLGSLSPFVPSFLNRLDWFVHKVTE